MAEVAYRFTFLDVLCEDEERAQDIRSGRARSEPPLGLGRQPCLSPEEAELQLYVRSLPGGITGGTPDSVQGQAEEALLSSEEAEMASYVQRESRAQPHPESITVDGPNLNMGSLGHPLLCKRPCVHVSAGRRCEARGLLELLLYLFEIECDCHSDCQKHKEYRWQSCVCYNHHQKYEHKFHQHYQPVYYPYPPDPSCGDSPFVRPVHLATSAIFATAMG